MNKIFLVGLPASGKTTIGRWLANKMNWAFIDIDESIMGESNMSISAYFNLYGEDAFRIKETQILRLSESQSRLVIACGGGTAAHSDNMMWMQEQGLTIFINTDLGTIQTRIYDNPQHRPLFDGKNLIQIREKLQELSAKRSDFYHKSKIIWNKSSPSDFLQLAVNQYIE